MGRASKMRIVAQRVSSASVEVDGNVTGAIDRGLLVLLGVTHEDGGAEVQWAADKVCNLRIFADDESKMNRSLLEIGGEVLLVSQFTLYGDARKGRRPSFVHAARGADAEALYEAAGAAIEARGVRCATGVFGADMKVSLVNDGPVTIMLDSSKTF
jgi:D-tyrosyl-tRNA(Tyr) deacylase